MSILLGKETQPFNRMYLAALLKTDMKTH